MGLAGVLLGLALLVWLSFRGWTVLLLAPAGAVVTLLAVCGATHRTSYSTS